jgi:surface polysaccharide O-acyltransferase-like enzyme
MTPSALRLSVDNALDPLISLKLRALSLLGIIMVVVGHAPSYRDPEAPSERSIPFAIVERLLTDALPRIVVMMFFAVSGFLLLFGHDGSWATHRRKIWSRTRSLMGPFVLWSLLGILLYLVLQSLPWAEGFFKNPSRRFVDKSIGEIALSLMFDPVPYQLWFLRDLWVMVLLSPLLRWLLQRFGFWVVVMLAVPHLLDLGLPSPVRGMRLLTGDTYFWFTIGGLFAVKHLPLTYSSRWAPWWLGAAMLVAIGRAWGLAHSPYPVDTPLAKTSDIYWFKFVHIVGVPALWVCYDRWLRWMERPLWMQISSYAFFVFVAHEPLMTMLRKPLILWLGKGDEMHAIEFFLTLGGTFALVLLAGWLLRRVAPLVFSFVCGGRGQ